MTSLPAPPLPSPDASFFLDFDGTLVALAPTPDAVVVTQTLCDLIHRLTLAYPGRVAVVSGRSIAQLDGFLGPVAARLALAGSHGLERRSAGGALTAPERPASLDRASEALRSFAVAHPGTIIETKSLGIALHYRLAPEVEDAALREAERVATSLDLALQRGKMMAELKPRGRDKGGALAAMLEEPAMAGSRPIMLGDDLTDEPGFAAAAAHGGWGVLVGAARDTAAHYRLGDVEAALVWLGIAAESRG